MRSCGLHGVRHGGLRGSACRSPSVTSRFQMGLLVWQRGRATQVTKPWRDRLAPPVTWFTSVRQRGWLDGGGHAVVGLTNHEPLARLVPGGGGDLHTSQGYRATL